MALTGLAPLLRKVEPLKDVAAARDIYEEIAREAAEASNGFMGRRLCRRVITMCHPKAWGDRFVPGYDAKAWNAYLGELADVAAECGVTLDERNPKT